LRHSDPLHRRIPSVIAQLRDSYQEREALLAEIAAAKALNQIHTDRAEVERKVQAQVAKWRALVGSAVVSDGRQLLNEILEGPLRFTPEGKTYRFVGPVASGRLIAGMVLPPNVASPRGTALLGLTAKPPKMRWMLPLAA
jgi:chorismate mutase